MGVGGGLLLGICLGLLEWLRGCCWGCSWGTAGAGVLGLLLGLLVVVVLMAAAGVCCCWLLPGVAGGCRGLLLGVLPGGSWGVALLGGSQGGPGGGAGYQELLEDSRNLPGEPAGGH